MDVLTTAGTDQSYLVVAVSGEVDLYTAPALHEAIRDCVEEGFGPLVIDLTEVGFMDSTGLGVLVDGLNRCRERDRELLVVCDRASLLGLFRITGLDTVFDLRTTVEDALAGRAG